MRTVRIQASGEYAVHVGAGLLARAGELTRACVAPCQIALICDSRVNGLFGDRVEQTYLAAGYAAKRLVFRPGEASKNWDVLGRLLGDMAAMRMTRTDLVVALGGGVTGDLAGFAAAIYARGIPYVQLPTTLLAAVDASVGGKTAVDLPAGKNLAGAFWQPRLVLCDTQVLEDLPDPLLRDGTAEILKCGMLADPDLFERTARGKWDLADTVEACVRIKRDVVALDERDTGARQTLNLGHTFGHAVELCSGYTLSHGQAVAIGLAMISRAAERMGLAEAGLTRMVEAALVHNDLPIRSPYGAAALLDAALGDKKRQGGRITLVVPRALGDCALRTVPVEALPAWLEAGMEAMT